MVYRSWEARLTLKGPVVDIDFCGADEDDDGYHGQECLRRSSSDPDIHKVSRSRNYCSQVRITIDPYAKPLAEVGDQTPEKDKFHVVKDILPATLSDAPGADFEGAPNVPSKDPKAKGDKKQKNVRPCRGQRIRHHKFFEAMKLLIDADPEGFDVDNIPLLPSLAQGSGYKSNLLDKLKAYKYHVVREREIEAILAPLR
jgi:hypothetical protein